LDAHWAVWDAGCRTSMRWTTPPGRRPSKASLARPWDAAHLDFLDLVAKARFGQGLTREQLIARARELDRLRPAGES
jgi:hypothetical protein